jgi:hypothetical protein
MAYRASVLCVRRFCGGRPFVTWESWGSLLFVSAATLKLVESFLGVRVHVTLFC